jgi:glycerophosphoryl diester phosphodiesterase
VIFGKPLLFAHRGARLLAPENTIEAFTRAQKLGATGLETDVWRTRDGVIVCQHDGVLRRKLRNRAIGNFTKRELPASIPSVDELFEKCGTEIAYSFDVKDRQFLEETISSIRKSFESRDGNDQNLWFCYEDDHLDALKKCAEAAAPAHMVQSTRLARIKEGPEKRAAQLAEMGIDAINMHISDWSLGLVTLFRRFDLTCFGYGAHHERELGEARTYQLDGVYSDDVITMAKVFSERAI